LTTDVVGKGKEDGVAGRSIGHVVLLETRLGSILTATRALPRRLIAIHLGVEFGYRRPPKNGRQLVERGLHFGRFFRASGTAEPSGSLFCHDRDFLSGRGGGLFCGGDATAAP
jgi:hypothetical protein